MAPPAADLSRGPVLLSFSLATASFAMASTFVRLCARAGINSRLGADDYASGVATVSFWLGREDIEGGISDAALADRQ